MCRDGQGKAAGGQGRRRRPGSPGRRRQVHLMDVKVGDRVLYAKYAGTEVKLEDKKYLILKESDILAVLD